MERTDQSICSFLHVRDPRGMEHLFSKYYHALVFYAQTFSLNLADSEDIVQELFLTIWQNNSSKTWLAESLKSYLFIAIKNSSLNRLKKKDPLKRTFDFSLVDNIWEEYDFINDKRILYLEKELSELSPKTREIIKSIYIDGLHYKEVAEKYKISEATVNSTLVRAIKKIRNNAAGFKDLIMCLILRNTSRQNMLI